MSCTLRHLLFVVTTFVLCLDQFAQGGLSRVGQRQGGTNRAKFLLTAPEKPHFDTNYTVTVTAYAVFNPRRPQSVELVYRGFKDSSRILNRTLLTFYTSGVQTWTVVFPWMMMDKYEERAVTLTLSTLSSPSNEAKKTLYFSRDTGYIFIQTDKPLYTPKQTVKFRIIAVDEYQKLAQYPLKVEIRNEKEIVMDMLRYSAEDAFKGQEFQLPKETPPGNWTITANYEGINNVQSKPQKVSFEVKEYVLPRFSAELKVSKDVITKNTSWITITVSAKYVYGQYALGGVSMQLGIWDPEKGVTLLPQMYTANLTKGVYTRDVRISKLIPRDMIVRANRRLYISVNVTEDGTGEIDSIQDTSVFIAHPYYEITHTESKMRFKPGFPYTLHTFVRARSGRPASWVDLYVSTEYKDRRGRKITGGNGYQKLNDKGKFTSTYNIPANAHTIKFKTYVLDFKAGSNNDDEFTVQKLKSDSDQYLHIELVKPISKYADGLVNLRYTAPAWYAPPSPLTVMVLSKGHKVFSHSTVLVAAGQSVVTLPKSLHSEVSPSMRIVATYNQNVDGDGTPEFVFDSLLVDTDDVCLEELSLMKPGGRFASPLPKKPKDEYKLQVKGGPFMKVGFVAVDKAVFLLNDKHSLTRESAFKQLNSHDQGTGIGDGITMEEVMMTSGLIHLFVETGFNELWRKGETSAVSSGRFKETKRPYTAQSKRGPNGLNAETSGRGRSGNENGYGVFTQTPPQTVRKYFPESWLFQEDILPKSGRKSLNLTLPDSITTWSFLAVGVSANRGVCVSRVLEQRVQKKFFVDVRLPYKVTRLEEVKVKVAVYNYYTEPIEVKVKVSGVKGLCFTSNSARGSSQNYTSFTLKIGSKRTKGRDIKVLPLENGDLTLTVDASSVAERDVVERNIYVVAEGMRMKKSLTFVLDPEAKHASFQTTKRRKVMLTDTATIKNMVDLRKKTQKTEIDLAMPKEIIRGTENCKISAFGDLMGDIINHAVINSKSLMEPSVHNAEEVLGDLGPTVHALLYANMSGLMDDALLKRAEKFVKHGVARLLRYRKEQGFALTPESPEGTWLTTAVLKTLCRSSKLAFVDKQILIDHGFYWLLQQARDNGTLEENDWRLAKNSHEYQVMLSADVLIAMIECGRTQGESHSELLYSMAFFLEDNMETIQEPMVMAKVTYALMLYEKFSDSAVEEEEGGEEGEGEGEEVFEEEEGGEEEFEEEGAEEVEEVYEEEPKVSVEAVKRLTSMSKMNDQGQVYWSNEEVTNEGKKVPFWYRKGVKASAIEATAYALLVFLDHPGANVDAIADWLVSQRNNHGSFISALDSMAAIEALSAYSLQKTGLKVDLSCNITSDKTKHYSHSFTFTELNAIKPESLNNVPVGHSLEVLTKGQGLGQMQINVEYNVPIDPNEACAFNVTLDIKQTRFSYYPDMHEDALCTWCTWWCRPIIDNTTLNANLTGNDTSSENSTASAAANDNVIVMGVPEPPRNKEEEEEEDAILELAPPLVKPRTRTRSRRPRPKATIEVSSPNMEVRRRGRQNGRARITLSVNRRRNNKRSRRTRRSAGTQGSASHKSICMKVCLQHLETGSAGHTRVDVDMLTGFIPVNTDIERMKKHPDVLDAWFEIEFEKLSVIFKEVSDEYQTCVGFRAVDHQNVERPTPANVIVTEVGNPAPSCAKEYSSPFRRKSLQAYCANLSNQNRGECRCYSGLCSKCTPGSVSEKFRYNEAWKLVCKSKVGYQLQLTKFTGLNQWVEMEATVLSANRTGIHKVKADDTITIRSPASCMCPKHFFRRDHGNLYMISPDVEKMVDRYGNVVHRYLLDEHSSFLRVSNPNPSPTTPKYSSRRTTPTVLHLYLKQAFKNCPVA